jgi:hypothetical protein
VLFNDPVGKVRILNVTEGKEVYVQEIVEESKSPINHLMYNEESKGLFDIRANQTISIHNLDCNFSCRKQVGPTFI